MQLEGYQYSCSQNRMRMRMLNVLDDVKRQHGFCPIITRPAGTLLLSIHLTIETSLSSAMCLVYVCPIPSFNGF